MGESRRRRRAGSRWRVLVHRPDAGSFSVAHDPTFGGPVGDGEAWKNITLPGTEFDELVVGGWIHIEQMDTGRWWMNIGGVTVWVKADRDGKPLSVDVFGPDDYAAPVDGCGYSVTWSEPASAAGAVPSAPPEETT